MPEHVVDEGDAFALLEDLPDDHAHAAVVDYPWRFVNQDRPGRASHENTEDWTMQDNADLETALSELPRVLHPGAWVFVFADDDTLPMFRAAVESTLEYRKTLIWDTKRIGNGHYFRSRHGYILAATNGDTDRYVTATPTVLEAAAPQREPGETTEYPTEKPTALYHEFLDPVVNQRERIIEPFCGTAPALEVAKSTQCDYWGCDISPDALRRAREREEQTTLV